jgi:hypothetical protein
MKITTLWLTAALLALCLAGNAAAGTILYTISDDGSGIPDVVTQISPATQTFAPVVTLGNGAVDFAGGLAYDSASGNFFTMSWDGVNPSSLASFNIAGAGSTTSLFAIGYGFLDGMVEIDATDFYAVDTAFDGSSSLYKLSTTGGGSATFVMSLGFGFNGGLATSDSGLLYAIANDVNDNASLYSIDPIAQTTTLDFGIGQNFTGGLAWDSGSQSLYAIASDFQDNSTLYQILPGNAPATTAVFSLGQGYVNASLVDMSSTAEPEPSSLIMGALGTAGILLRLRQKRRSRPRREMV